MPEQHPAIAEGRVAVITGAASGIGGVPFPSTSCPFRISVQPVPERMGRGLEGGTDGRRPILPSETGRHKRRGA